ncbi:MAG: JAB domain-containing protein, partial [bacterium]
EDAAAFLRPIMFAATGGNSQESFFTALLDVKNRLIGIPRECTRGLLDSCPISPSIVLRAAVQESAASVILAHTHPSSDPTPSKEDIDITRRLIEAAKILGIRIVDHIIIGRPSADTPGHVSLREKNLVAFE